MITLILSKTIELYKLNYCIYIFKMKYKELKIYLNAAGLTPALLRNHPTILSDSATYKLLHISKSYPFLSFFA